MSSRRASFSGLVIALGRMCLGCGLFLMAGFAQAQEKVSPAADERPNVIILLTDDQGYGDFSFHGNPVLKTPMLDRFAGESVRLTDFHVAPMCTPTRGELLSGLDAVRNGATSVTAGRSFLRPGVRTAAEFFSAAGYRTGIFGKWHLGDNYPHRPMDRGFQEAVYHRGWGFTSAPEMTNTLFNGRYVHNGLDKKFPGYCTDFWFDQAMEWMKRCRDERVPFFCYLPTNAPHAPHVVDEKYSEAYKGRGPAAFFGMIANIDENLGRLETFLRDNNLRENTIVVVLTDNGGTAGVSLFNAGMRGGKTTYYEGGHRVPCFMRWPAGGFIPPGNVDALTQVQDLLPTLLDLAKIAPPSDYSFDGRSLSGLLRGTEKKSPERTLIVQYGQQLPKFEAAVLTTEWRLVKGTELFHRPTDPGQKTDVAAQHPEVVSKLRAAYEDWWAVVGPKTTEFVTTSLGAAAQPVVDLTSSDWEGIYSDNSKHVRQAVGGPQGGHWNVFVERDGNYEVQLRRWPHDMTIPLSAADLPESKAVPIAGAKLRVADQNLSAKTGAEDQAAVFRLRLPRGRTQLQGWFQDAEGRDLCGSFFARVTRLGD